MALTFHPKRGQILKCDFDQAFRPPEMVKPRPVIVLSGQLKGRGRLVTVVAVSATPPEEPFDYHYLLPRKSLPQLGQFQTKDSWVKGDMVYAVSFDRLNLYQLGKRGQDGKRLYYRDRLGRENMREVYRAVLNGLGLHQLPKHL